MGESVELSRIAAAVGQDKDTTRRLLHHMMDRYQEEDRGIQIIELEQSYQMCTKKEYYENLIQIALHPQKPVLTDVMLETLSIIVLVCIFQAVETDIFRHQLYFPFWGDK